VAWRAPIDEDVKSAAGLSVTGATVTVRAHGGAQVAKRPSSCMTPPMAGPGIGATALLLLRPTSGT
jgi:hypothetical protein